MFACHWLEWHGDAPLQLASTTIWVKCKMGSTHDPALSITKMHSAASERAIDEVNLALVCQLANRMLDPVTKGTER